MAQKNRILEANAPKFWFRVVCCLALAAAALIGSETSIWLSGRILLGKGVSAHFSAFLSIKSQNCESRPVLGHNAQFSVAVHPRFSPRFSPELPRFSPVLPGTSPELPRNFPGSPRFSPELSPELLMKFAVQMPRYATRRLEGRSRSFFFRF